jgi:hypothetical protein
MKPPVQRLQKPTILVITCPITVLPSQSSTKMLVLKGYSVLRHANNRELSLDAAKYDKHDG